jgi:hypothetical protein
MVKELSVVGSMVSNFLRALLRFANLTQHKQSLGFKLQHCKKKKRRRKKRKEEGRGRGGEEEHEENDKEGEEEEKQQ